MDLIAEIKARLTVEQVVGSRYELRPNGYKLVAKEHESLTVDPRRQVWSWFSQPADVGQRCCGGDLLSWLAYNRFGRCKVEGEQFTEIIKEACGLCGLDYDEHAAAKNPAAAKARADRLDLERRKRETMAAYMDVARSVWTPTAHAQAKQRKSYLSKEVIERRELGIAPTWKQCTDAGIGDKDLRLAGLLRDRDDQSYMFFRECIVIPWLDAGETVFISSRRLMDTDRDGALLDKQKKSLSMFTPDEDGTRGVFKPAAFNLDALRNTKSLFIVEGPLDAIACEERGHSAIALGCKSPTDELCKRLSYYPGITLYLALDGTDDVDAIERASAAGRLGLYTKVCELPQDKDPDDLTGGELSDLKADAVDAVDAWLNTIADCGLQIAESGAAAG